MLFDEMTIFDSQILSVPDWCFPGLPLPQPIVQVAVTTGQVGTGIVVEGSVQGS